MMASRQGPAITVITVVLNGAASLAQAIESVLAQRYDVAEYIVIDGGSTDGTVDIIRRHEASLAYWVSEPDLGIYDAMNKALAVATGKWAIFIGADDELTVPLKAIVQEMTDPDAVYYGDVEIAGSGAIYGGRYSRYRLMQRNICHQSIFYPRSIYGHKRYDLNVGMLADHKYNIEVWGSGVRFVYLPRTIARFNDQGLSSIRQFDFEPIKLAAIKASFGLPLYAAKRARNLAVRLLKAAP